ncbi:hypothetical protein M951_chr367 (nucleomorph) [Lotharella oceanica]|uniref:Uncharacterized protein n=1 Tax=Lotharella oceanica TaxID=641309 RepID=A0A060DGM9_9EUKA|nr:hypothetical protein M951_chr367 [Lotharella oceanica]|mmetsp:Transcript_2893/g.5589  ORF Transcript_2893/g.5589 Transcript_2893/m.5589 type:complete len:122 (+) Transcript_2893:920-1285(+)
MKNENNLKRRVQLNKKIKKKSISKKRKFNKYFEKKCITNTNNTNIPISNKKSNKYSDDIKKSKGFSIVETKIVFNNFKVRNRSLFFIDHRRNKILNSTLKINTKKLFMMHTTTNIINQFKN